MKAYIIVDVIINDPIRYEDYKKLTPGSLVPMKENSSSVVVRQKPLKEIGNLDES
jgi:hypothetical protein